MLSSVQTTAAIAALGHGGAHRARRNPEWTIDERRRRIDLPPSVGRSRGPSEAGWELRAGGFRRGVRLRCPSIFSPPRAEPSPCLRSMLQSSATFPACFAWLGLALFIDGIDGTLARAARVTEIASAIDGVVLDLVVDFLTYVLVPMVAIWRSDLMSRVGLVLARPARHLRVRALFRGHADEDRRLLVSRLSRALERGRALSLRASPAGIVNAALLIAGSAAMFAPIVFVHPLAGPKTAPCHDCGLRLASSLLSAAAIAAGSDRRALGQDRFLAVAAYFLSLPLLRHSPWAE